MLVNFFGSRGSLPSPGLEYNEYGGNTSCIQIVDKETSNFIILDGGTGLRNLATKLLNSDITESIILLSHFHWDHILGIPFFKPFYIPKFKFTIYGPKKTKEEMYNTINHVLAEDYFPVNFENFKADIKFDTFDEHKKIQFKNFKIEALWTNHPCYTLSYKISLGNKTLVYLTDHEPYTERLHKVHPQLESYNNSGSLLQARLINYLADCDLLIIDAEYTKHEYKNKYRGWGHSSINDSIQLALECRAKQVILHHHGQERTDEQINMIYSQLMQLFKQSNINIKCTYAKENSCLEI